MQSSSNDPSNSLQSQYQKLKLKLQNQIKKNNSLLKMNNNLMKQNELYQNGFNKLKHWKKKFMNDQQNYLNNNNESKQQQPQTKQQQDESIFDIQDGEQFIIEFTQQLQKLMNRFKQYLSTLNQTNLQSIINLTGSKLITQHTQLQIQNQHLLNNSFIAPKQCTNCLRWKQLYTKETKETTRLQKIVYQSSLLKQTKQINMNKLKNDVIKLLNNYLEIYRIEWKVQSIINRSTSKTNEGNNNSKSTQKQQKQTIRPNKNNKSKSKQKKQPNSLNNNSNNPFSKKSSSSLSKQKQKTARQQQSNPYTIQLPNTKQNIEKQQFNTLEQFQQILTSYSDCYKNAQEQLNYLKDKLKEYVEIVNIYRQKQINKILYSK